MALPTNATLDHLTRIAAKPGVRSTLILSKADGAIIRSTGLTIGQKDESKQNNYENGEAQQSADEIARMAFSFVNAAGDFAHGMQDGNDVQLLRLRTKKNEIVIVPGAKVVSAKNRLTASEKNATPNGLEVEVEASDDDDAIIAEHDGYQDRKLSGTYKMHSENGIATSGNPVVPRLGGAIPNQS